MRYAPFLEIVEQTAGITRPEAERAAVATLATLGERITGGEARDVAAFLPPELRAPLEAAAEPAEAFGRDEFIRRVAEREGVDPATAREHARAVFVALRQAVAPGELRDMVAQLPKEFGELVAAAGAGRRAGADPLDLVGRVAQRTGLDHDAARRATEAVLQTLAIRISAGEVEDLAAELPADVQPALHRGLAQSRAATVMSRDEFLDTVAVLEGVDIDEAERHARAVFAALRDLVSSKELSDLAAQLSADYAPLLA